MSDHEIDFDSLVGQELDFYGVDEQRFKLDDQVYEVIGDDDCAFPTVLISEESSGFHDLPIARVVVERGAFNDDCYELVDLHDGHCWLSFGVEIRDTSERSYDTQFVFEYSPKGPGD